METAAPRQLVVVTRLGDRLLCAGLMWPACESRPSRRR